MKIVIINCIPFNTGDLALLKALISGLEKNYDQPEIIVACDRPSDISKIVPEYTWVYDFDVAQYVGPKGDIPGHLRYFRKILQKLNLAHLFHRSGILRTKSQHELLKHCKESDHVFLVPGGYIHDYYDIRDRIYFALFLINKKIKVSALAHSIGPFWKESSLSLMKRFLPKLHSVTLRENYSSKYINSIVPNTFPVTQDLAFYLHTTNPELFKEKKVTQIQSIAVCFREWVSLSETEGIINKATEFLNHIHSKYAIKITFLSTCQGNEFYKDDKIICDKINKKLSIEIDSIKDYHGPEELIKKYSSFDAYVGMRMHGAIFSMLGGTPALNIGYEDKTKGVYELLDLPELSINYREDVKEWIHSFDLFYQNYNQYLNNLKSTVEKAALSASKNFDHLNSRHE